MDPSDWRSIGRRFGKKLRDIFHPNPDNGPSDDERRDMRLRDVLKGFAYFDTFGEVEAWKPQHVDPIQVANTPLLVRTSLHVRHQVPNAKVLLCHDYKGGYHDYESVAPATVPEELYSCKYLRFVDTFVYFSHKLVCIPPPTWTNALHRNGVKVLGTFIIEPATPDIENILQRSRGQYLMAEQLAKMVDAFAFDGWLINVEKEFSSNRSRELVCFIQQLKKSMGHGRQVIWYDALNSHNLVDYQNGLSTKNVMFAEAAGALFTNYKWTETSLSESKRLALANSIDPLDVYFGIDVWAQNTKTSGPPRITFPPEGGGGTNSGLAVQKVAESGFSAALFGPAWTHEHFSTKKLPFAKRSIAEAVERALWKGAILPKDLGCDCSYGTPHHTALYHANSLTRYAREHLAGSAQYFDTNFTQAFGRTKDEDGQISICSSLGSQSILPFILPKKIRNWEDVEGEPERRIIYGTLEHKAAREGRIASTVLQLYTTIIGKRKFARDPSSPISNKVRKSVYTNRLCLYKLAIPAHQKLQMRVMYNRATESKSMQVGVYVTRSISLSQPEEEHMDYTLRYSSSKFCSQWIDLVPGPEGSVVVEVGVFCKGTIQPANKVRLMSCVRLSILPESAVRSPGLNFTLDNLRIVERGTASHTMKRLAWDWHGNRTDWPSGMPWSKMTGPFSHFVIQANDCIVAHAYSTEYPLTEAIIKKATEACRGEHEYSVRGVLFGNLPLKSPCHSHIIKEGGAAIDEDKTNFDKVGEVDDKVEEAEETTEGNAPQLTEHNGKGKEVRISQVVNEGKFSNRIVKFDAKEARHAKRPKHKVKKGEAMAIDKAPAMVQKADKGKGKTVAESCSTASSFSTIRPKRNAAVISTEGESANEAEPSGSPIGTKKLKLEREVVAKKQGIEGFHRDLNYWKLRPKDKPIFGDGKSTASTVRPIQKDRIPAKVELQPALYPMFGNRDPDHVLDNVKSMAPIGKPAGLGNQPAWTGNSAPAINDHLMPQDLKASAADTEVTRSEG